MLAQQGPGDVADDPGTYKQASKQFRYLCVSTN